MKTLLLGDIYGNDRMLYYPDDDKYIIYATSQNLNVGLAGELTFKVPVTNPAYSELEELKIVTLQEDEEETWRGFIKSIKTDIDGNAEIYCLEDIGFMKTEFIAPEKKRYNKAEKLAQLINWYNSLEGVAGTVKTFEVGYVSAPGTGLLEVTYDTDLLAALRNFAGDNMYVRVRREYDNGHVLHRYIDFVSLAYFGVISNQKITFGDNVLKFLKELNTSYMLNVIYPYGAEIEGEEVYEGCAKRIVGTPLQNNVSIQKYGRIAKNIQFNTDDLQYLQEEAAEYLERNKDPRIKMELTAVDLADAGYDVDRLVLGDRVRVIAEPFNIDQYVYITDLKIDLLDKSKNKITLSSNVISGTSMTSKTADITEEIKKKMPDPVSILTTAKNNAMKMLNGTNGGSIFFEFDDEGRIIGQGFTNNEDLSLATVMTYENVNGKTIMTRDDPTEEWEVKVAETRDGQIVADFITTGTLNAARIAAGILADKNNNNYWDLDNSELYIAAATKIGGKTAAEIANEVAAANVTAFINNVYSKDIAAIEGQIDQKADTWHQDTDPSVDWYSDEKGISLKFNAECVTESDYDYISIYYRNDNDSYDCIKKTGNFGGQSLNIPATEFWIYWHTDSSQQRWGWKVDAIDYYGGSDYTTPTTTGAVFPSSAIVNKTLSELESEHPYTDYMDIIYHVTTKTTHKGDLWYRTTDDTTWYYDGTAWIQQDVPKEVFDKIDGKAQIFLSTPVPPYNEGDLWIVSDPNDANYGEILTCINPAETTYLATDWNKKNKYTDDSAVNNLGQYEIWRRLTANSNDCIILNGTTLGIKATAIATGLIASRENASTPAFSLNMDTGALTMNSGTFRGLVAAATVQGSTIQGGSININNMFAVDGNGNMTAKSGTIGNLTLGSGALYAYGTVSFATNRNITASKRVRISVKVAQFIPSKIGVASNFQLIFQYYVITSYSRDMYVRLQYRSGSNWYDVESYYLSYSQYSIATINFSTSISYTSNTLYRVVVDFLAGSSSYRQRLSCSLYTSSVVKTAVSADGFVGKLSSNMADIGGIHFESNTISSSGGDSLDDVQDGFALSDTDLSIYDMGTPLLVYNQYVMPHNYVGLLANGNVTAYHDNDNYVVIEYDGYVTYMKNGTSHSSIPWSGSDRRIKEDITALDMEMSKALIDATDVYKFRYKNDEGHHYGVMAQDVREVLDNLGEYDSKLEYEMEDTEIPGSINVAYQEYIPLLINYVKDLRAECNALRTEINEIKQILKERRN